MKTVLLRLETPYYVAGAIFERRLGGVWVCVHAAPILRWMLGRTGASVGEYVRRKAGWTWSWRPDATAPAP